MPPGYLCETGHAVKRAGKARAITVPRAHEELQGGRGKRAGDGLAELRIGAGLNRKEPSGDKCKKYKNCSHGNPLSDGFERSQTWNRDTANHRWAFRDLCIPALEIRVLIEGQAKLGKELIHGHVAMSAMP